MIEANWHVITGGPSSGKTTLINELAAQGFMIAPEIARDYIRQLLNSNHNLLQIQQDIRGVQRGILSAALRRERQLRTEDMMFLDRGTVDSLGYFNYYGIEIRNALRTCSRIRYKKVFYCHPLPVVSDEVRVENNESAGKIGELIHAAYSSLGYELIELPAVSVEERMALIQELIGS